ncbi:hypothetical protein KSP40_PGU009411 [Platanthera guangdongensis]|uniref:Uncharacterized protein n=1 Tax=Platanthera guangdongensis TaxID=2320717 RepID=A0ABR2LH48_9ASPA
MPKSSRHKSHRSDKHSSRDVLKRSDSENGGSWRDRMKRSDEASVSSEARVLRTTEGKKRKSSSPDVYLEKDKDDAENCDSSSGKRRKERGEDLAKPDTCNGSSNDDRLTEKGSKREGYGPVDPEKVKNSKALSVESKSRYSRHEYSTERHGDNVSRTESAKRRSESEHALIRDYRDHKERDRERYSEREKVRECELVRDKKVQHSRHGRSDEVKSQSQHSRRGDVEVEPKAKKGNVTLNTGLLLFKLKMFLSIC